MKNKLKNFLLLFLVVFYCSINTNYSQVIERPKILGLAHVSFKVSDIETARKYYGGFLGYEEAFTFYNPDKSISVTFFKVNDRQYIEITPNLKADEIDRLGHICFETNNLEQMRKYLASRAVLVPEKLLTGRDGNLHMMVTDPDGHRVEFVQFVEGSTHLLAKGKFLTDKRISDRLLHTGIIVKDIKAADKFYKDILGFSEFWRGGVTDSVTSWINMKIPDGTDYIEYMLVDGEQTPARIHSAHHICLMVPDLQKTIDSLRAKESGFEIGSPKVGRNNRWLLNMYDHDGTRIELMEPHTVR